MRNGPKEQSQTFVVLDFYDNNDEACKNIKLLNKI